MMANTQNLKPDELLRDRDYWRKYVLSVSELPANYVDEVLKIAKKDGVDLKRSQIHNVKHGRSHDRYIARLIFQIGNKAKKTANDAGSKPSGAPAASRSSKQT